MIDKLSSRNIFIFALIVFFGTICLLPMNLPAGTDHDNLFIHDVSAQTQMSVQYNAPIVYCGPYATIGNNSNIAVRYYFSSSHIVRIGGRAVVRELGVAHNGWVPANETESYYPSLDIDMSGERKGNYTATGDVTLKLKFDFNDDGEFDDERKVSSSASTEFDID